MVDPMTLMTSHLVTIATDYRESTVFLLEEYLLLNNILLLLDLCNSSYHTSAKSNHIVF